MTEYKIRKTYYKNYKIYFLIDEEEQKVYILNQMALFSLQFWASDNYEHVITNHKISLVEQKTKKLTRMIRMTYFIESTFKENGLKSS